MVLSNEAPTVVIDFRWFNDLAGGGQLRYGADLINGLSETESEFRFLILGTRPAPIPQIAEAFRNSKFGYLSMPRFQGRGWLYVEQMRYYFLLRRQRPSLFHALHTFLPIRCPVPIVATALDMMLEIFPEYAGIIRSRDYRLYRRLAKTTAKRMIAISTTTAEDLCRLWALERDRVRVVYLSSDNFHTSVAANTDNSQLTIISPYNLEPRKNLSTLLKAVADLKARGLAPQLILFGRAAVNAEREAKFQREVDDLEIRPTLSLAGVISDEQLCTLLASATMFAFPSLYEGFGLPVLEAMRSKALVISHDSSAMAEVLGDAGLKIDMTNAKLLADTMEEAFRNLAMREKFKDVAVKRGQEFSRVRMIRETLEVYREAMSS